MPNYFSGTNCRASGVVIPPAGWSIAYMELDVGGETTDSLVDLSGEPTPPMGRNLKVMFDSTHFTPLDDITVSIYAIVYDPNSSAWDEYFVESDGVPVLNRYCGYARYDLEVPHLTYQSGSYSTGDASWGSVLTVAGYLESMNYDRSSLNFALLWSRGELLGDLPYANVVYVASHGNPSGFASDINDYWFEFPSEPILPWQIIEASDILPVRQAANGTGLPPYNTGLPSVNLAFVMACCVGQSEGIADAFLYPGSNYYSQYATEDQCELGYSSEIWLNQYGTQAIHFFLPLEYGRTAKVARDAAESWYYADTGMEQPAGTVLLVLHGDPNTKTKGVYATGDDNLEWWSQI